MGVLAIAPCVLRVQLSPVHTKNDNYKDKDISVHTSGRYRLFIYFLSYIYGHFLALLGQDSRELTGKQARLPL